MSDSSQLAASGNRRTTSRAPLAVAVKQRIGESVFLCQSADIGPGGMLLARASDESEPEEAKCWLEFALPGSDEIIVARGRLVRQQKRSRYHLMAVRFLLLAASHRRVIARYAQRAPRLRGTPSFLLAAE